MRCVKKKQVLYQNQQKTVPKVTGSLIAKRKPEFKFHDKFSLLVVGPKQNGKTFFV